MNEFIGFAEKMLSEHGASAVSAYVTHPVFPKESWRRFTGGGFAHFWVTDSCPTVAAHVSGEAPFEVLSLAGRIADLLGRSTP